MIIDTKIAKNDNCFNKSKCELSQDMTRYSETNVKRMDPEQKKITVGRWKL